jgi:hypothetical protein
VSLIPGSDEEKPTLVKVIEDITERKRAEDQLLNAQFIAVCRDKRARGGGTREFNDRRLGGDVAPDGNISIRMVAASSLEENV